MMRRLWKIPITLAVLSAALNGLFGGK